MPVCEIDLRSAAPLPRGARKAKDMGMGGVFRDIIPSNVSSPPSDSTMPGIRARR
jgi:hypothetical protein